jgi:hypothetical protein
MTSLLKLLGIALVALVIGGGMGAAVQAARSPVSLARAKLAEGLKVAEELKLSEGSKHACTDLNEGTFEWRWANVPLASTCEANWSIGRERT